MLILLPLNLSNFGVFQCTSGVFQGTRSMPLVSWFLSFYGTYGREITSSIAPVYSREKQNDSEFLFITFKPKM